MEQDSTQRARKLGILVSSSPDTDSFRHAFGVVSAALEAGCDVYAYCIDEAVKGVARPEVQSLKGRGLKLYACAYGAHRHGVPVDDSAAFAGLTVVSDLIAGTDRFVSFN
ncbi:MAG: DsrE family protein [Verrucomicrobiota bacterium]